MKLNRVLVPLIAATVLGGRAVVGTVGDASTANDILGFLSPQARAVVLADSTWTAIAVAAFLWLAFELSRDAGHGKKALDRAREANERAWAFEPEFRDKIDEFSSAIRDVIQTKALIQETRDTAKRLEAAQDSQREFLEKLQHYSTITNKSAIDIHRIMENMKRQICGYHRGIGVNYIDGREWLSMDTFSWGSDRVRYYAHTMNMGENWVNIRPNEVYKDQIRAELGSDVVNGKGSIYLDSYMDLRYKFEQIFDKIEQDAEMCLSQLYSIDLRQSPQGTGSETQR